jgi:hypothetical protein
MQERNEKKALDRVKKKAELEWDELQAQMQQMEQVKWPLLVHLTFKILLGIIGILAWGVGFIPQSAWAQFEKDENLVEAIWASRVAYAKPLKVAWGVWNWTLESNKMQPSQRNGCNIQVSPFQNHSWAVYFHIYIHF